MKKKHQVHGHKEYIRYTPHKRPLWYIRIIFIHTHVLVYQRYENIKLYTGAEAQQQQQANNKPAPSNHIIKHRKREKPHH